MIIGGVAGGATTAARLRRKDETAEIVVLEKGEYISYANCGLPYYIGDVIQNREALLLQTLENMKQKFNIDVRVRHEAVGIDGTEVTLVHNGEVLSGYCEDNIIDQHIDDKAWRSPNSPNQTSGLKSVILYRVVGTEKTVIYGNTTKAKFSASDTNSSFDMYYEIGADEKDAAYYLIVVSDHAGNVAKKKLISQYSLLTWFHTSIERSTYR